MHTMPTNTDNGHASNVVNFEALLALCTHFGAGYNPANAALQLPALQTLLTNAQTSLSTLSSVKPTHDAAVAQRAEVFGRLAGLTTRISNALSALSPNSPVATTVRGLVRRLRGERATPTPPAEGAPVATISVAQTSFDNRVANFEALLEALQNDPAYQPNEIDLQVGALQAFLAQLRAANQQVLLTALPLSTARDQRDALLYGEPAAGAPAVGLTDVAQQVKAYVKSVWGTNSPQYGQANALRFRKKNG